MVELRSLLAKLNPLCRRALETAVGSAVTRSHHEVTVDHFLAALADEVGGDVQHILRHLGIPLDRVLRALRTSLDALASGNSGRPVLAPSLVDLARNAWLIASVDLGGGDIRSGAVLAAYLAGNRYGDPLATLLDTRYEALRATLPGIIAASVEEPAQAGGTAAGGPSAGGGTQAGGALARFTVNFTARAREGKIDPVFARDREIRQIVDILGRRRKNNPIAVGDAGVGKTAVVEGLALRMVQGDVPEFLRTADLLALDLGLLQAGASVKGEFENRLKQVIEEIKASARPIVLFIDEAHTLIGAGGQAGTADAANLLKPALARGELRTIAATTWSEYKKYFEKDPALARRFQLVKLDEPSPDDAVTIIRGLRDAYETAHGVYIRDEAIVAAARMSARYISGRQLPDKAVDVLDTACARVRLSQSTKPSALEQREREGAELVRERDALIRDRSAGLADPTERLAAIADRLTALGEEIAALTTRWEAERAGVDNLVHLRRRLQAAGEAGDRAAVEDLTGAVQQAVLALDATRGTGVDTGSLVFPDVGPDVVGQVIGDWTGIPAGRLLRDEMAGVARLADNLRARIKGQDEAINVIDEGIRAAKVGLGNPSAPMGVFLLVGSSGVGKTEMATTVADLLFGGERFLISINMSEFQEKHTISRLVGSPPGYVGFGEGGVLTEAVRQRPYSVVLLDEVEKADLEVLNLFYQVFDKGTLSDGEGRVIDFRNTVIFLTSNLATDIVTSLGLSDPRPTAAALAEAIRPALTRHFKPALLARMQVVPFFPLKGEALESIVRLKLDRVGRRLQDGQRIRFHYTDAVVGAISDRCTEVDAGARNIDHIVNRTLLPRISAAILDRLCAAQPVGRLRIDLAADGDFALMLDGEG
ncbi:MAG: hypothetical protein RLY86_50 [Pseudomonadota bacterium]|jgi:type VI secretion system protein VasG